mmetsp:Transcript_60475/g.107813  ORF Transcript_60475/g.107813 Transcript_60475/m.107813 type:complete len:192 (-) Transcript_60475:1924-2499(-)
MPPSLCVIGLLGAQAWLLLLHIPMVLAGNSTSSCDGNSPPLKAFVCASAGCPKASTPTSAYRFRSQYGEDMYAYEVPQPSDLWIPSSSSTAWMPLSHALMPSHADCRATPSLLSSHVPGTRRTGLTRMLTMTVCCSFTGTMRVCTDPSSHFRLVCPPLAPPLWSAVRHGPAPHQPTADGLPTLEADCWWLF